MTSIDVAHEASMTNDLTFNQLELTNHCVVICDLTRWIGSSSPAWTLLTGAQDDIGRHLASLVNRFQLKRLDDFGGIAETFLRDGDDYPRFPPQIKPAAAIFSFTPRKWLAAQGLEMARVSSAAGYSLMIITVQKHAKFGKVWVLCGLLRHHVGMALTYYEDTDTVVDELKGTPEGTRVLAVHVTKPGFESYVSKLADRVVSQTQYEQEVLE